VKRDKQFQGVECVMRREVDLWFAVPGPIRSVPLLAQYHALLTAEERKRGDQFRFHEHRHDYLVTRALVRVVLGRCVGLPPQRLRFGTNRYGRPFLRQAPQLSFNIAHTTGLIVLAVAYEGEIGVDVEQLCTGRATQDMAERFFAPAEAAVLRKSHPLCWDETFFSYWTLKEAYIKARGVGLSLALDSFEFDLARAGGIGFRASRQPLSDGPPYFCLLRPGPAHLAAVCVRNGLDVPTLNCRRIVPWVSEHELRVSIWRESDREWADSASWAAAAIPQ
jgi:4'-phosphopantetheinyl transferase